jgi:tetratricopeptide (TPR) repeat protein
VRALSVLSPFIDADPRHCDRAMASAAKSREHDNVYGAYAEGILADSLLAEGRFAEAAERYRDALRTYERHYRGKHSPDAIEIAGATQLLVWSFLRSEQYDEAVTMGTRALELNSNLYGPHSAEVGGSLVNVATALMQTGELGTSTEVMLKRAQNIYGGHDLVNEYILTTCTLGTLYLFRGDLDGAERELTKASVKGGFIQSGEQIGLKDYLLKENKPK